MENFSEQVDRLTIHGIRHIFQKNVASRVFWILTFCASVCGLAYYSINLYIKLSISPDITVRINEQIITAVPFPAITICTPVFAKDNLAHYFNFFRDVKTSNKDIKMNLTIEEQNYLASNIQACNLNGIPSVSKHTANRTEFTVRHLNESFLTTSETLLNCDYKSFSHDCSKMFLRIITDKGFCYTFNLQGFNTIFNEKAINDDFHCFKRHEIARSMFRSNKLSNETVNDEKDLITWTPDKGYLDSHEADSVPVKAQKGATFRSTMYLKEIDALNICSVVGNIFSFYIHAPNEIPMTYWHLEEHVEFKRKKDVILTATSYKAEEGMRKFSPKSRGCYFEGEKPLKFFKSYTKAHCEFECMTNYTLKVCGCLKFSMPRTSDTPVCTLEKASCYYKTMNKWPNFKDEPDKSKATCGCLKACNVVKYGIKNEKSSTFDNSTLYFDKLNISIGDIASRLSFVFDDYEIREYEEYAVYKLHNFIADVGGLLGLFIGCSVLSLIEIVYFVVDVCAGKFMKSSSTVNNKYSFEYAP